MASTVIFWERSPWATAVVTWAMLRTWAVRLPAMEFTFSVRSRQVPETPCTCAWPPSLPSVPTSRATRVTSSANDDSWSTIVLMVSASARNSPLASTVIFWERSPWATAVVDLGDVADLVGQVAGHEVDVLGEVPPGAGDAAHLGLAAELALGADLARHAGHLVGERGQLVDHRVHGRADLQVFALEGLALDFQRHLLGQVALRHRDDHARPRWSAGQGRRSGR